MSARGYNRRRSLRHTEPVVVSATGFVRSQTMSGTRKPRVARMAATLTLVRKDTTTSGLVSRMCLRKAIRRLNAAIAPDARVPAISASHASSTLSDKG
ncbi:hypothetical protein G6F63_013845 [Rhizopus arrhizus]|nr:hypothetical protein G6F63_013845 [Rhizopus arrhizus]